jgi:enamine deaminase RidA (YjgF/YER057c/UK114 family)
MTADDKLKNLGFDLDNLPAPAAQYQALVRSGNLIYLSGALPSDGAGRIEYLGKVGRDMTTLDAQGAARLCAANLLRLLRRELGSLDAIKRVVKITGYVNSAPGYSEQHLALNGASELLVEVLGEAGKHARAAVGVAELPLKAAVEIEAVVEV